MKKKINDNLENAYQKSKGYTFKAEDWVTKEWDAIKLHETDEAKFTGIDKKDLQETGVTITSLPEDMNFHRLVKKIFEARKLSIESGQGIDWGTAEALAFATLIKDGYDVRISGQDVERGTFSHRHAHVFHQDKDGYYNPINQVIPDDLKNKGARKFIASNSHLSEYAVLGYELGYA
jgi:2-oxoglutarate dehydrogenase E1 component